jgi:hypothetical protein
VALLQAQVRAEGVRADALTVNLRRHDKAGIAPSTVHLVYSSSATCRRSNGAGAVVRPQSFKRQSLRLFWSYEPLLDLCLLHNS